MKNVIGARLKNIRTQHEMSQVELAAALEVEHDVKLDRSDISEIERGQRGVKDFELDAFAKVLDVTPAWLLRGGEEEGNARAL